MAVLDPNKVLTASHLNREEGPIYRPRALSLYIENVILETCQEEKHYIKYLPQARVRPGYGGDRLGEQ